MRVRSVSLILACAVLLGVVVAFQVTGVHGLPVILILVPVLVVVFGMLWVHRGEGGPPEGDDR
jgi:hypothetical protein